MVESRVVNIEDFAAIAALPSKEGLIAKVLFLINAPAQRIAVALNGVARNLAVVIGQAVEQKKFHQELRYGFNFKGKKRPIRVRGLFRKTRSCRFWKLYSFGRVLRE